MTSEKHCPECECINSHDAACITRLQAKLEIVAECTHCLEQRVIVDDQLEICSDCREDLPNWEDDNDPRFNSQFDTAREREEFYR